MEKALHNLIPLPSLTMAPFFMALQSHRSPFLVFQLVTSAFSSQNLWLSPSFSMKSFPEVVTGLAYSQSSDLCANVNSSGRSYLSTLLKSSHPPLSLHLSIVFLSGSYTQAHCISKAFFELQPLVCDVRTQQSSPLQ